MITKEIFKKKILYRSMYRGTKEMDLLLGNFVKKYIDNFDNKDLVDLNNLLNYEDEDLYNWYFKNINNNSITKTNVASLLKRYKFLTSGGRGGIRTHE